MEQVHRSLGGTVARTAITVIITLVYFISIFNLSYLNPHFLPDSPAHPTSQGDTGCMVFGCHNTLQKGCRKVQVIDDKTFFKKPQNLNIIFLKDIYNIG